MATFDEKPYLLIGIDFGMTFTGVAWTNFATPGSEVIADWPGSIDDDGKKVPTKMIFQPYTNTVEAWGYQVNMVPCQPPSKLLKWWKIFLDQQAIDNAKQNGLEDVPQSVAEAQRLVVLYLQQVYNHIKESIQAQIGLGWNEKKILFLFSVPTTWTSHAIVETFRHALPLAGFGRDNPTNHTVDLGLTEAEAAGVYTLKESLVRFAVDDIILICDAGGGTTDFGLFRIKSATEPYKLVQLDQVKGVTVGSTLIDMAFANLVRLRLRRAPELRNRLPRDIADRLAEHASFRNVKHSFGEQGRMHDWYYIPAIPSNDLIPVDVSDMRASIEQGRMRFSRAEIQALFDEQINKIIVGIGKNFEWMRHNRPMDQVKYLVLSGGLGSSAYLRSTLMTRLPPGSHPNAVSLSVIRARFPQLAVVKGLVMDKAQRLERGESLLPIRRARRSYGVICRERYDESKHIGEATEWDGFVPGLQWAVGQIEWIVVKGQEIAVDRPYDHPFTRKLRPGDPNRTWATTIVVSDNEPSQLPISMRRGGATTLCSIHSTLTNVPQREFEEHSKHCWSKGKHHFVAKFSVRVIVGPADLKFELWFKGRRYSSPHDPVQVQWDVVGMASRPVDELGRMNSNDSMVEVDGGRRRWQGM